MEERYRGSRAYEIAREKLGGPCTLNEKRVRVDTSVKEVLDNNPRRVLWTIVNRGTTNAAIGFSYELTYEDGLVLGSNGGTAIMTIGEDGEAVGYGVYAVLESGSAVLYVLEVIGL